MIGVVVVLALVSTGAPETGCGLVESYRMTDEWRAGAPPKHKAIPLRRGDACEQAWFQRQTPADGELVTEAEGLDDQGGPPASIRFTGEPGLQLFIETRRARFVWPYLEADVTPYGVPIQRQAQIRGRRSEYRLLVEHAGHAALDGGTYHLALARVDEPLMEVRVPLHVSGPVHVQARAVSYTEERTLLGGFAIAGVLAAVTGGVWSLANAFATGPDDHTGPLILLAGGAVTAVVSAVVALNVLDDEVEMVATPE